MKIQDIKEQLHDGSYRVTQLLRHDGVLFNLPLPIEYASQCIRLATAKKSDDWRDTADAFIVTIGGELFEYHMGIGHRFMGKPKSPQLGEVLACLVLDASTCDASFDDWCDELGHDTDSRKALELYFECQKNAKKLRKAGVKITDDLREFLQEYK